MLKSPKVINEYRVRTLAALVKARPDNAYPTFFEGLLVEGYPDKSRRRSDALPELVVQDLEVTDWSILPTLTSLASQEQSDAYCEGLKANLPEKWRWWYERAQQAITKGTGEGYDIDEVAAVILNPSRCDWAKEARGLVSPIIEEALAGFEAVTGERRAAA